MTNPHEGRPPHPTLGPPLSGLPYTVEGITFRPYRAGVNRYVRISDDFRIELHESAYRSTIRCVADGHSLGKAFRLQASAVRAAVKMLKDIA